MSLMTEPRGAPPEEVGEPRGGGRLAPDVEPAIADHVHHDYGLELRGAALALKRPGEGTRAVDPVGGAPVAPGFLPVEEDDPVGELPRPPGERPGQLQEEPAAGSPIVGPHEPEIEKELRVVVAAHQDRLGPPAGQLGDDVDHPDRPVGRLGREGLLADPGTGPLELAPEVLPGAGEGPGSGRPRAGSAE